MERRRRAPTWLLQMRDDHVRGNLDQNAVNFLNYEN
jgi:hypothetical protein